MKLVAPNFVVLLAGVLLLAGSSAATSASLSLEATSEDGFDPNQPIASATAPARRVRGHADTTAGLMAAIMRAETEPSEAQLERERDANQSDTTWQTKSSRRSSTELDAGDDIERAFGKASTQRYVLRCWQEGRLIVQRDLARMPQLARTGVQLEDRDGVSLQLFDLQNATCMVQQR
jgi:hypothetical protein